MSRKPERESISKIRSENMKKNPKGWIAVTVAGILLVLCLALNAVILFQKQAEKLHQSGETVAEDSSEEIVNTEEDIASYEVTGKIDDFSIDRTSNTVGTAATENAADSEYLCQESLVRVLNDQDVANLKSGVYENLPAGKDIIQMVINEIYARNGYQFENPEIQAYFESKSWYQVRNTDATDMETIYNSMSDIDKANVDFLRGTSN